MNTADLLPVIYDDVRKLGALKIAAEKPGQTLDATALVHKAKLGRRKDRASSWS
jgi:hypothetical protein